MDGAGKWKRMLHIDIPAILPTAIIMFILRMGSVMGVGFEKVYLLQNTLNSGTSEIISTYVYKMGLVSSQYSLSAAIGLFNNIINLCLLLGVNWISKKISDTSLM
jgi:putative aldouronate transport system permease protein